MLSGTVQPTETGSGESTGSLTNVPGGSVIAQVGIRGGGMEWQWLACFFIMECMSWLQFSVSTEYSVLALKEADLLTVCALESWKSPDTQTPTQDNFIKISWGGTQMSGFLKLSSDLNSHPKLRQTTPSPPSQVNTDLQSISSKSPGQPAGNAQSCVPPPLIHPDCNRLRISISFPSFLNISGM